MMLKMMMGMMIMMGMEMDGNNEEALCYAYEKLFLLKVPGVNQYLIKHADDMILIMEAKGNLCPQFPPYHIQH
jgi:hypothetical protein